MFLSAFILLLLIALGLIDLAKRLVRSYDNTIRLSHKVAEVVELAAPKRQSTAHKGGGLHDQWRSKSHAAAEADWGEGRRDTHTITTEAARASTGAVGIGIPSRVASAASSAWGAASASGPKLRIPDALAHPIWWAAPFAAGTGYGTEAVSYTLGLFETGLIRSEDLWLTQSPRPPQGQPASRDVREFLSLQDFANRSKVAEGTLTYFARASDFLGI